MLSENILDVTEATFEREVLMRSHEVPVVVDFWAPWCAPCRQLSPLLERQAIEAGGRFVLAKINVDDSPNLSVRYGVQGIPAVKAFQNGEVVSQFVGAQPEARVRRFIDEIAPDEASQSLAEAQSLLGTRHWPEAEAAFSQIIEEEEDLPAARLGLIQSLLMQGQGARAADLLEHFPAGAEWAVAERLRPLAALLMEAERTSEVGELDALQAQVQRAAKLIQSGNLAAAMDGLLEVLRVDKMYKDGLAKDTLLALFSLLGDQDPLTREYRDELASILF